MGAMASQITSLTIVYSTVYSGADQSKLQSSASLAFVWGIHPHKWPVTRKMFQFDDVVMWIPLNNIASILFKSVVTRKGMSPDFDKPALIDLKQPVVSISKWRQYWLPAYNLKEVALSKMYAGGYFLCDFEIQYLNSTTKRCAWSSIFFKYNVFTAHYDDVIMTTLASQITSLTIFYSIVYSGVDQRKHQSSASLAFVRGIHRGRWIPRTKGQ